MVLRLHTRLCEQLGIQYPIVQAGMAGGPTTAALVAAVSEAGGLGTLGAAYMSPEAVRETVREIRKRTERPFAVNLFAVSMKDDLSRVEEVQRMLHPLREEMGISEGAFHFTTPNTFTEQFQVLIEEQVPIISTAFGILKEEDMRLAKEEKRTVITMVTSVKEALTAQEQGADILVAQGSDAGGHRGTFSLENHPYGVNVGTFSLVPQVVDAVEIPVIAAGGIMDGRGLVAALALGARGVQLGTRFLTAAESGAHPAYKQALLDSTEESTVITKAFSGRPARGIRNTFIRHVEQSGTEPLPFPSQNTATSDIRKEAARQNNPGYMSLWAGQAARLLKADMKASDIVQELVQEAASLLHRDG